MIGKEKNSPCMSMIYCRVIPNFIVLGCRNTSHVKIAFLVIIHCNSQQSKERKKKEEKFLTIGIHFYHGTLQLQANKI